MKVKLLFISVLLLASFSNIYTAAASEVDEAKAKKEFQKLVEEAKKKETIKITEDLNNLRKPKPKEGNSLALELAQAPTEEKPPPTALVSDGAAPAPKAAEEAAEDYGWYDLRKYVPKSWFGSKPKTEEELRADYDKYNTEYETQKDQLKAITGEKEEDK